MTPNRINTQDDLDALDLRIEPILRAIRAWAQTRSDTNKQALWEGLRADMKLAILEAQRDACRRQIDIIQPAVEQLLAKFFNSTNPNNPNPPERR